MRHLALSLLFVACLLTACATTAQPKSHPALTDLIERYAEKVVAEHGVTTDGKELATCMTSASLAGVPEADLAVMETAAIKRELTPEGKRTFAYWMGPSVVYGAIAETDNYAHYKDGTPRDYVAEKAVSERVTNNAKSICPALAAKYPQAFRY